MLSACVGQPQVARPKPLPAFNIFTFFAGDTAGTGRLTKVFAHPTVTDVRGNGHVEGSTLVLDQRVSIGGKPSQQRTWRIRETMPGHYVGTLTDASGPVTGEAHGNLLHLAFTMKGGLPTEQWLTLADDGRSAHNIMVVRKFGVRVAVLVEDIRKIDQAYGSGQ